MALTKLTSVDKSVAKKLLDTLNKDLSTSYVFDTVADFKASLIEFPDGKTIHLNDRDADFIKISGTGTANTFNIIASASVNQSIDLIIVNNAVSSTAWGIIHGGPTDNSSALVSLLQSGISEITINDVTGLTSVVSTTLTADTVIKGSGHIKWIGTALADKMVRVICNGFDFYSSVTFDCNNLASGGLRVENTTIQTSALPTCKINGGFLDAYMTTANIHNYGCLVIGSFESVIVEETKFKGFSRAAGTGVIGSSGTAGCIIASSGISLYPKNITHRNNTYSGMGGEDAAGVNDVDLDYLIVLIPDPTNFPNGDATFNEYPPVKVESYGNNYKNPVGRAEKFQCVPWSHHNTIIRDGGRTMNAGSNDINCQWGVGTVEDITWELGGTTSPITTELIPVSMFNSTDYGEIKSSATIRRLVINNNIPAALNNTIDHIISLNSGAGTFAKDQKQVLLHDITMAGGKCNHLTFSRWTTATVPVSIENISLEEVVFNIVGLGDSGTNLDIVANNVRQFGANIPFINSYGGGNRAFGGKLTGGMGFFGINQTYERGASFGPAPMLAGGALSDGNKNTGGSLSVQSVSLADDTTHVFDVRGFGSGECMASLVSTFFGYSGMFALQGESAAIVSLTESQAGFSLGTGSNPDTDGKINLWVDANGALNIKNRLGSTRTFTASLLG